MRLYTAPYPRKERILKNSRKFQKMFEEVACKATRFYGPVKDDNVEPVDELALIVI